MSLQSEQRKSQNIESDLVSIFIYLLYVFYELWSWKTHEFEFPKIIRKSIAIGNGN